MKIFAHFVSVGIAMSSLLRCGFTFRISSSKRDRRLKCKQVFAASHPTHLIVLILPINTFEIHRGLTQIFASLVRITLSLSKYYVFKAS